MAGRLPGYDEALARVLAQVTRLPTCRVALSAARNRVLRRDVVADRDQPPFDRSAMDGFAVRSVEVKPGASWPITGTIAAGAPPEVCAKPLRAGETVRIATGAPLPPGADAVAPIEQATVAGETVRFLVDRLEPWRNVHRRGSDAPGGGVVIRAGTRLGPQHLGIAAAVGATELEVTAPPRVTLLTTGDEVVPPEVATDKLQRQQIRNSNGPMLRAFLAALGVELLEHVHVPDEAEQTLAAAREALSHSHLVLTVGGVSVGQRDHLPAVWGQLGLTTVLHGVSIQPGKPVLVARPPEKDDPKLVLGLPGNPVSVLVTAHLFAWPVLRVMLGEPASVPWRDVSLAGQARGSSKREVFRAAALEADGSARVIDWHGSGDLAHTAGADGWVRLPLREEAVSAGQRVAFVALVR